MSKGKGLALFGVAALFMGLLVSTAPASVGANTCSELFPGLNCTNGGCDSYGTAGNCTINNCWCRIGFYVDHNCNDGKDNPRCD